MNKHNENTASGFLHLKKAKVNWNVSIDNTQISEGQEAQGKRTFRTLKIEGKEIEFSDGFTELHTESYSHILSGNGFGVLESKKAIEIVQEIRQFKS